MYLHMGVGIQSVLSQQTVKIELSMESDMKSMFYACVKLIK
jgi:hypothetical protein